MISKDQTIHTNALSYKIKLIIKILEKQHLYLQMMIIAWDIKHHILHKVPICYMSS
jgi:hypothetical protein